MAGRAPMAVPFPFLLLVLTWAGPGLGAEEATAPRVPDLVRLLTNGSEDERARAEEGLALAGGEAVGPLAAELSRPGAPGLPSAVVVRAVAQDRLQPAEAVVRLGGDRRAATRLRLHIRLSDALAPDKPAAAAILGCCGAPGIEPLIELLGRGDERLAAAAEEALARIGPEAVGPVGRLLASKHAPRLPLEVLLTDDDPARREDVEKQLARAETAARLRFYLLLPGRPPELRRQALGALTSGDGQKDWTLGLFLLKFLADEDPGVRSAATAAVNRLPPPPPPDGPVRLVAALADGSAEVRSGAVKLLEAYGARNAAAREAVLTGLDSKDARVRAGCAGVLTRYAFELGVALGFMWGVPSGQKPTKEERAWLESLGPRAGELLQKDPEPGVRAAALRMACWSTDTKAVPLVEACLRKEAPEVRTAALHMARGDGFCTPAILAAVIAVLDEGDDGLRLEAVSVLGGWEKKAGKAAPRLTDLLESDKAALRKAAAEALSRIGPKAAMAVPRLIACADDPNAEAAQAAVRALGLIGADPERSVPALVRTLEGGRKGLPEAAAFSLGRFKARSAPAVPALVKMAARQDERERLCALWALAEIACAMGPESEAAGPVVRGLDDRGEGRPGAKLLDYVGGIDRKSAMPVLLRALRECRPEAQAALIGRLTPESKMSGEVLAADPCVKAIPAVREAAASKDPAVRAAAAAFLARVEAEPQTVLAVMMERLADPDPWAVVGACHSLGEIKGEGKPALPRLVELLRHERKEVRMEAAVAIGKIGADAEATVLAVAGLLEDKESSVRFSAMTALLLLDKAARPAVPRILELVGKDRQMRRGPWTWEVLYRCRPLPASALPVLRKLLDDEEASTRSAVASQLGTMGAAAREAGAEMLARLAVEESPRVRASIVGALGQMDPANADTIARSLEDKAEEVRNAAAAALVGLKDRRMIPRLVAALADENANVRGKAVDDLERYGPEAAEAVATLEKVAANDPANWVRGSAARALKKMRGKQPGPQPLPQPVPPTPEVF